MKKNRNLILIRAEGTYPDACVEIRECTRLRYLMRTNDTPNALRRVSFIGITLILSAFFFTGCPFFKSRLSDFECMTAEELTEYMNKQCFGSNFTLIDYEYEENSRYKMIKVNLAADNLPGKTVRAFQTYSYDYEDFADSELARMTVFYISDYYYTDYYAVKYETEIKNHFDKLYSPITGYKEDIKYKMVNTPEFLSLSARSKYNDVQEIFESTSYGRYYGDALTYNNYILINYDFNSDEDFETEFYNFCYDLRTSEYTIDKSNVTFYFTSKYNAEEITDTQLVEGSFFTLEDIDSDVVVKKELK